MKIDKPNKFNKEQKRFQKIEEELFYLYNVFYEKKATKLFRQKWSSRLPI